KKILEKYKDLKITKVIYESPFRLVKLLEEIREVFGDESKVSVCREMTKKFEEVVSGGVKEVLGRFKGKKVKGELVVVVE
ncbi:16S rRNA (cytidine(1402)-2'-O)-methyltransferase, partial [Patescibacteria group bacterium]|nr:16S rRNA (cytidine(1402)-2'-O)-methyltransferase [Patescibacteria group bacterium]